MSRAPRRTPPIRRGPAPPRPPPPSSALLGRLGRGVSRHHRWVALVWLVIVAFGGVPRRASTRRTVSDNFRIPDTGSQSAYDLLQERFSSQNAATATVVFSVPEGQQLTDADNAAAVAAAVGRPGQGRRRDVGARPAHPEPPDPARAVRRRARPGRGPGGRGPRPEPAALGLVRRPHRLRQRHLRQEPPRPARAVPAQRRRRPASDYPNPYSRAAAGRLDAARRATSPSPSAAPSPTPTTARCRGGPTTPTRSASASAPCCCSSPSARCSAWPSRSPPPCSAPSPPAASSTCWPPSPPCRRPPRR